MVTVPTWGQKQCNVRTSLRDTRLNQLAFDVSFIVYGGIIFCPSDLYNESRGWGFDIRDHIDMRGYMGLDRL
jgi:hypothetical protein